MRFTRERNPVTWLLNMVKRVARDNPPRKLLRRITGRV